MPAILSQLLSAVLMSLRGRASLQLELVALRHQIAVLERKRTPRPRLRQIDRFFWVWLYRLGLAAWTPSLSSNRIPSFAGTEWAFGCSGHGSPGVIGGGDRKCPKR